MPVPCCSLSAPGAVLAWADLVAAAEDFLMPQSNSNQGSELAQGTPAHRELLLAGAGEGGGGCFRFSVAEVLLACRVTATWSATAKGLFSSLLSRLREEIAGGGAMLEHQIKTVSLQMLSSDEEQVPSPSPRQSNLSQCDPQATMIGESECLVSDDAWEGGRPSRSCTAELLMRRALRRRDTSGPSPWSTGTERAPPSPLP